MCMFNADAAVDKVPRAGRLSLSPQIKGTRTCLKTLTLHVDTHIQ